MSETISPSLEDMRRREAAVEAFASAWGDGMVPLIERTPAATGRASPLLLELALVDLEERGAAGPPLSSSTSAASPSWRPQRP